MKEIINEIIYDGNFNKTLNKYSNELFSQLINDKLFDTINELLVNKLSKAYSIINELKIKMNDILSYIEINEENMNINSIINNYKIILSNQNNQFIFKVSNSPFEYLYSFIKDVLEPPILEIKEEYNIIENKILQKIVIITNNFPDFSEIIKAKLIEKIHYLLLKYENDLNNDYDSYINKLIHYTYINGLETFDEPCHYSFCSINISQNKTQFNKINIIKNKRTKYVLTKNKNTYNIKKIDTKLNHEKAYKKFNKYIKNMRLLSEMKSNYDETMGAISKDDIIPFLLDIKTTIFELNKTYINNFDKNAKLKTNQFIVKINGTYKIKLKNSILKSASKFSSILSRESYNKLIDNMLKQYYKLENYLNNITLYLENDMNGLITILTNTSTFIGFINDLSFEKLLGYYDILIELIQDKYKFITDNNEYKLRNLDDDDPEEPNEIGDEIIYQFKQKFEEIKIKNSKIFEEFIDISEVYKNKIEGIFIDIINKDFNKIDLDFEDLSHSVSNILYKNKIAKLSYKQSIKKDLLKINLPPFIFLFPSFPNLQLRIVPLININLNFEMAYEIDLLKDDYSIAFDVAGRAEVSVSLEVGCYFPSVSSNFEISLSLGLRGTLGSGKVGLKLSIFINNPKLVINLYFQYNAFSLSFYILFQVKLKIGIINFSFSFYLMNKELFEGLKEKKIYTKEIKMKKISNIKNIIKKLYYYG